MNPMSIVAWGLAAGVLAVGVLSAGDIHTFLDPHAILIVLGGTIASGSISFQLDRMWVLVKVFLHRVIRGRKGDHVHLIRELMSIAEAYRTGSPNLQAVVDASKDHFLKEAMGAVSEGVFEPHEIVELMRTRAMTMYEQHFEEAVKFKTVGKYPPAFGLMGTTLSMITLLQQLGQPGAQNKIGPAMAHGLVATFFGVAFANLFFAPIAENLVDSAKEHRRKNMIIIEGVRLIMLRTNPIQLAERLNSFLLPGDRIDWRSGGSGGAKKAA